MTVLAVGQEETWPDITAVPRPGLRSAVARRLFAHAAARLPVTVVQGDEPGPPPICERPVLRILRPERFHARLGAAGLIGFGESYMAGEWECDDLPGVLTAFAEQMSTLVPPSLQRLRRFAVLRSPAGTTGDRAGARRNAGHHYDLSNELFALFLDETMTYSAALFDRRDACHGRDLAGAQHRKIDRLLDRTGVGPGTRVLEIGTGWGELALRAGRRGAQVRSLTLSTEQRDLALARIAEAGLADRVRVDLCDYRDAEGTHDAVLSVEMIEAVGERHWPEYFRTLRRLLAPGGRAGLQAITMPHDRMLATRDTHTWIQKYIFPGGFLPSVRAIEEHAADAGLRTADVFEFGGDYALTLRLWRERFLAVEEDVAALGFDAVFRRMWELYLAYSEAGFRSGYLDVGQFLLTPAEDRP
ncbi:cyclopropane-fatty-acyl-phospholipid synthase family protein [Spirillospora sp. NPDC047279]|uniref:cyclopropane-fatty-acyl-phospholipid synthase family protein n=1 Tax=Spirillospora sp. NPDC047279 TaxID=3155478 RepID=UPI0033E8C740